MKRVVVITAAVIVTAALLSAGVVRAQEAPQLPEKFTANLAAVGGAALIHSATAQTHH